MTFRKSQPPFRLPLTQKKSLLKQRDQHCGKRARLLDCLSITELSLPCRKEERTSLSPTPLNTQVPDSFCAKTSLQTHFDFWEAAQLYSSSLLPASSFPGWEVALGQLPGAGLLWGRQLGKKHDCQGPPRLLDFSGFRTLTAPQGRHRRPNLSHPQSGPRRSAPAWPGRSTVN